MPSITQLAYIAAVHRTGNFGKAAAECAVSQPTLSAQVAKAEEELGVVLFDRRSRPVQPTEPGRRLIALAVDVLSAHHRLLAAADGSERICGSFTLGIIPTLAPYVLPWFLGPFAERHPGLELTVLERTTGSIVEQIKRAGRDREYDCLASRSPEAAETLVEQLTTYMMKMIESRLPECQ